MGVYVAFPDGSMHWDESKADPNPNGGSVLSAVNGQPIPGANRQSGSSGPGGNGVRGSQANPNGDYHGNVPTGGGVYGSGGFTGGTSGVSPLGQPGDFSASPFANWLQQMLPKAQAPQQPSNNPMIAGAQAMSPGVNLQDWFTQWAQRQNTDRQAQQMAANMQQPFAQSGIPEGTTR